MHIDLSTVGQFNPSKFALKGVYKGARSEGVMLCLLPGQEMPTHPHERFEVILMPQTGTGVMTVSDKKDVKLVPGTLYYEEAGNSFRIVNNGTEPFQALIHLVRVSDSVPHPELDIRD